MVSGFEQFNGTQLQDLQKIGTDLDSSGDTILGY